MERATRADVAHAAGVAPSTVSLVLNGRGRDVKIAPATIERVRRAARDLNYIPNAAARSLRRGKSHLIALLMAELPDDPFVPVVHTVLTTAMINIQRRGYLLLPLFQSGDGASDAEVIQGVLGDTQLAGIIRETTSAEAFTSRLLANLGIPVVSMSMIEAETTGSESALVRIDEGAGVRDILSACALIAPGEPLAAGRAVFLAGPNTNHARQNPIARAFGTSFTLYSLPDWEATTAYQAALRLLADDPSISLVALADDSQAPGVFQAASDLGLAVPSDLSILGFGNQDHRSASALGLTTVDWPLKEMTEAAVASIINVIEGRPPTLDVLPGAILDEDTPGAAPIATIPTRPVWRSSVARRA
ncbi:LacI family transcriptional regulator [Schaalia meyeri]|uniref:LacI family DNA-binding transcriptional regulator n=1 Tax=Schaalia meyeri TaxID=52773 RepID=UPI002043B2A0|nr:LacI family DNA-binding transcriptional regulator [Schaalia meyeri]MCM3899301.1 LacI family transcriptional regulator [Schaalia meyeri]